MLGGSLIRPKVEVIMAQASRHFVHMPGLEEAAGKRIAQMLSLPEGYSALVTSGAAAAIQSGLAGILTGDNETLIKQLPDLAGMKSEVIIQKSHRNPFDHQLRGAGVKLIEIETRDQLRAAVSDRTAMMHFTNFANDAGQIKVDEWVKLAKEYRLPCFNDAAADTPPISHLWDYTNMGYDLGVIQRRQGDSRSAVRWFADRPPGPHSLRVAEQQPVRGHAGPRPESGERRNHRRMKGARAPSERRLRRLDKEWQDRLELVSREVTKIPGVTTKFFTPAIANHVPHMHITWDSRISFDSAAGFATFAELKTFDRDVSR